MSTIAIIIDHDMKLLTTPQKLHALRKSYSDEDIINSLEHCSRGNREALTMLLNKWHTDSTYLEREELFDKDIIESMKGEE